MTHPHNDKKRALFYHKYFGLSRALAFGQPLNHHPLNQVVEKKKVNDFYPLFDKEDEKYCRVKGPHYDLDFPFRHYCCPYIGCRTKVLESTTEKQRKKILENHVSKVHQDTDPFTCFCCFCLFTIYTK